MTSAQCTIGIGPIRREMIEKEAMVEDSHRNSDQKVFCCPTYGDGRDDTARAFLIKMGLKDQEIVIHSTKISRNYQNGLMWVTGTVCLCCVRQCWQTQGPKYHHKALHTFQGL